MKITKAVITAAGLGTRMLPIARAVPKEMLPIVDKPTLSYLVEEAASSGITDILIITGRDKYAIENYFDYSIEYEDKLKNSNRANEIEEMRKICNIANIHYIRQKETKGLGHAVLCAKSFVGTEPFMVLYGDDIIFSKTPVCKQLIDAYDKYNLSVAGVKSVDLNLISKYCSLNAKYIANNEYSVSDMIEKPLPHQIFTNLSILGRVLLTSEIFDILENTRAGANNEIQLTDAMKVLAQTKGMIAVEFEGKRYDMGSKLGFMTANVEQAINHPEIGDAFKQFLKEFVKTF